MKKIIRLDEKIIHLDKKIIHLDKKISQMKKLFLFIFCVVIIFYIFVENLKI